MAGSILKQTRDWDRKKLAAAEAILAAPEKYSPTLLEWARAFIGPGRGVSEEEQPKPKEQPAQGTLPLGEAK